MNSQILTTLTLALYVAVASGVLVFLSLTLKTH